jgi:hypothetical protein
MIYLHGNFNGATIMGRDVGTFLWGFRWVKWSFLLEIVDFMRVLVEFMDLFTDNIIG